MIEQTIERDWTQLDPVETAPAAEMQAWQLGRLREQLTYVTQHSAFYREAFRRAGVGPEDLRTLDDLRRFPLTTKDDLHRHADEFVCVEPEAVYDYGATTGTTGAPVLLPVTQRDWERMVVSATRGMRQVGIGPGDVVQLTAAFDQLFAVGFPLALACRRLGAATVRMGPGNTGRQVDILRRTGANWLICGSQYLLTLAREAVENGLDPRRDLAVRAAVVLAQAVRGENWRPNALHRKIDQAWGIELYEDYGSMEMYAGFIDCSHHGGHHTCWDRHAFEVLDPETLEPVPDGEVGELVFTHLTTEGIPLVRFRQGDLVRMETAPCACGRTAPRIMEALGRTDEMLKIKDTSVYPRQIEDAIMEVPGVEVYVVEVDIDEGGRERILVRVSAPEGPENVTELVRDRVKARARLSPVVSLVSREEIIAAQNALGTRKAKTFWDRRPSS